MKGVISILLISCTIVNLSCNNTKDNKNSVGFRNDLQHSGMYSESDISSITNVKWSFKTNSAIRSTPLAYQSKIYFGSGDKNFYCLDQETGKEIWRLPADGGISSSACISSGNVYFTDRKNNLYSVKANDGTLNWKKNLGPTIRYEWAFDPFLPSPILYNNILYTGSIDGNLYAINPSNSDIKWKYKASSSILSTPAINNNTLLFGDVNGKFYAISSDLGKEKWVFHTYGDSLNNKDYGFDRKGILSSAIVKDGTVIFGSRDGYLYAVDENTGAGKWKVNYDVSWVMSSAAVSENMAVTGTSDGHYLNCIDIATGKEIWRFSINQPFWSSPIIFSNTVVTSANDGFLYTLDLKTGKEKSKYRIGDKMISSPIIDNNTIFIGSDDGFMYALNTENKSDVSKKIYKEVFWIQNPPTQFFRYGIDVYIRDYFTNQGYDLLNEAKVDSFLLNRIKDKESSVIVFATNFFPKKIIEGATHSSLLYQYLANGGKVVVLGPNPTIFDYDFSKNEMLGLKYSNSDSILGIKYPFEDLRSNQGPFGSLPTKEGRKWGLTQTIVTNSPLPLIGITPLALNENEEASYWAKNYGFKEGTGFVQLWLSANNVQYIEEVKKVAEYGLFRAE